MKIVQDKRIRIYELTLSQIEISKVLVLHDIDIEEIQKHLRTLEDYFYDQIHGGGKAD
jgi:ABC-2 type transport system ATP-binding protein